MADSFTPTLNLTKPEINQSINTWGNKLNGDMDLIDQFATETEAAIEEHEERLDAAEPFLVPVGLIAMWSGAENAVPAGWALCDGSNGTPNLRDKFIMASGPTRPVNSTGGANSVAVATDAQGFHAHTGVTAPHAITEGQMPSHSHGVFDPGHGHAAPGAYLGPYNGVNADSGHVSGVSFSFYTAGPLPAGTGISIAGAGGNQAHAHGIVADGNHAHNVTVPTVPVYYSLAFIMKKPAA
ncbi:hypothetical protein GXW71_30825 [Roseomonas hellenica]|uniref:Tail fiber protein n=1 Tax=Plastoroseomonas hellenica TaxID=2687306 RepID=A0ABS5F8A1_9PROT|nr:hypothetical protein [Plastoroseomonas hellenica]MBR0668784.1 hypothetical protein [Plastoroseomonas hellenica]